MDPSKTTPMPSLIRLGHKKSYENGPGELDTLVLALVVPAAFTWGCMAGLLLARIFGL